MPDNASDRQVLEVLYREMGGADWWSNFNWRSNEPMDTWAGVTTEDGRVAVLELRSVGLTGEIPEELGNLPRLRKLDLRGNELSGCIPHNQRLRNALFNSYYSGRGAGTVPGWHKIVWQALIDTMSDEVGLESLRSSLGHVEDTVGFQQYMEETYGLGLAPCPPAAPDAGISGEQSSDTDKAVLLAVRNYFVENGTPESSFESWTGAMQSDNRRIEPLRSGWRGVILNGQGRVVELWLDGRELQGEIPPFLGALGQLVELNLSKNFLTGTIPPELGNLRNLRLLAVNQNFYPKEGGRPTNGLNGRLPPELGHLTELRMLSLDDNPFLTGPLPLELGNLTHLEYIYLQRTGFTGCLPPPLRPNFSPTLASLFNEAVEGLTLGKLKQAGAERIKARAVSEAAAEDVQELLDFYDESFGLYMDHAPLNEGLDLVSRALKLISIDTIIKPGSTLSHLGNVKLTC